MHAVLRAALEDAVREDLVPRNVAKLVRLSVPERADTSVLSADEGRLLLKANRDDRLSAALVVMLLLGLRRSEVLGLRWEDVDLAGGVLRVRQGLHRLDGQLQLLEPKTRRSRKSIPLPRLCTEALQEHRDRQQEERASAHHWIDSGFVFVTPLGTPIDPRNFSRQFAAWCERAGVPVVRLHDLRHTCVSLLLSLGVPPRVVMGDRGPLGA